MDDDILHKFDASSLRVLAENYKRLINRLEARACELDAREEMHKSNRSQLDELNTLPGKVCELIAQGRNLDAAISHVARTSNCPVETVEVYWNKWIKSRDEKFKQERIILVMQMRHKGLNNSEISLVTGIPDYTISRMISKALDRGRK